MIKLYKQLGKGQAHGAKWAFAAGLVGVLMFLGLSGCERSPEDINRASEQAKAEPVSSSLAPGVPPRVTSASLPESPRRIVSLAPNITEILFAIGAGDRVVAVTRFCDYPPQVESLPKTGGIHDRDFETLLAARPDLILGLTSGSDANLPQKLDRSKLSYALVGMENVEATLDGILYLGELVGQRGEASEVVEQMRAQIATLSAGFQARAGSKERSTWPSVLMVYDHQPVVAAGRGTFGHELIGLAGGRNVLEDIANPYPVLDIEQVLSLDPDRLIDASVSNAVEEDQDARFWQRYTALSAVRNQGLTRFQDPVLMRPGPRLPQALKLLGEAIHSPSPQD